MIRYITFIPICLLLAFCDNKSQKIEFCFQKIKDRIGADSILNSIKNANLDSYPNYASIIHNVVEDEVRSNKICFTALEEFRLENEKYSLTVINLLFFQKFQAFLLNKTFNKEVAIQKALQFEARWK